MNPTQIMDRVDPKPILKAFLQDLHSRVNTVCGMTLRFAPRIQYPIPLLVNSAIAGDKACLSNRSQNKSTIPYRSSQSIASICTPRSIQKQDNLDIASKLRSHQTEQEASNTPQEHILNNPQASGCIADGNSQSFTAEPKQISNFHQSHPIMKDTSRPILNEEDQKSSGLVVSAASKNSEFGSSGTEKKLIPLFRPKQAVKKSPRGSIGSKNLSDKFTPIFKPIISKNQVPLGQVHLKTIEPTQAEDSQIRKTTLPIFRPNLKSKPSTHSSHIPKILPTGNINAIPVFKPQPKAQSVSMNKSDSSCKKRKSATEGESTKRAKPEIKKIDDADMEKMARQNQLAKVNVASMIAWLREKGIHCKTKDKKTELVDKVRQLLNVPAEEE